MLSDKTAKVFIGFHESANKHFERLSFHLAGLERAGLIEVWSERKILPGSNPLEEIKQAITTARIAILLFNADFFALTLIAEYEIPLLLATAQKEGMIILSVMVSPCALEYTRLSHIPTINGLQNPLSKMSFNEKENIWVQLTNIIKNILTPGSTWSYSLLHKSPKKPNSKSKSARIPERIRKQWRSLGQITYPVLSDSDNSRIKFIHDFAHALDQVFNIKGYTTFTGLVRLSERNTSGQIFPVYEFICHQPEFCEAFRQRGVQLISQVLSYKNSNPGAEELAAKKEEMKQGIINESLAFAKRWSLDAQIHFSSEWAAIKFIYDPSTNHISIRPIELISLNPSDYPEHITTTSELLIYLASLKRVLVGIIDDFNWYKVNYPLLKLTAEVLEKRSFRFDGIKINVHDYEEWDYEYPQLDAEAKRYRA